jgi:tetratricopeptide (TPR) repeat protein
MTDKEGPAQLIQAGRFDEALSIYGAMAGADENDALLRTRSVLLMILGRYDEAAKLYGQLDDLLQQSKPPGRRALKELAVAQWLAGQRASALQTAKQNVEELAEGRTTYTDYPGGVEDAVVLMYFALAIESSGDFERSINFMRALATRTTRIKNWPGPLANYILGNVSLQKILEDATGHADLRDAREVASQKKSALHRLVQALFVFGLVSLRDGDVPGYQDMMAQCASLPNPHAEVLWYLARCAPDKQT